MSWTREITIWCDEPGCTTWRQEGARTVAGLRKRISYSGWVFRDGKDLCPEHRPRDIPIPEEPPLPEGVGRITLQELRERTRKREEDR